MVTDDVLAMPKMSSSSFLMFQRQEVNQKCDQNFITGDLRRIMMVKWQDKVQNGDPRGFCHPKSARMCNPVIKKMEMDRFNSMERCSQEFPRLSAWDRPQDTLERVVGKKRRETDSGR